MKDKNDLSNGILHIGAIIELLSCEFRFSGESLLGKFLEEYENSWVKISHKGILAITPRYKKEDVNFFWVEVTIEEADKERFYNFLISFCEKNQIIYSDESIF